MDASPTTQGVATKIDASDDVATMGFQEIQPEKDWQREFIKAYAKSGNQTRSAALAGISPQWVCHCRRTDARFRRRYERAKRSARRRKVDKLEQTIYDLATKGHKVPLVSNGKVIGTKRQVFPGLAVRILEAEDKGKWTKRTESRSTTTAILVSLDHQKAFLSDPAYAQAICVADALLAAPRAIQGPSSPPCPVDSASEAHGQTVRGVEE
jgi:hypothetical protein